MYMSHTRIEKVKRTEQLTTTTEKKKKTAKDAIGEWTALTLEEQ